MLERRREIIEKHIKTGMNILDLIDLQEIDFREIVNSIYRNTKTAVFKEILLMLRTRFSMTSKVHGRNVIRYLLQNLREETLNNVLPNRYYQKLLCEDLFLSAKCVPFEKNPYISNLAGGKTSEGNQAKIVNAAGIDRMEIVLPYLSLKNTIIRTGEIYCDIQTIATEKEIIHMM